MKNLEKEYDVHRYDIKTSEKKYLKNILKQLNLMSILI